MAGYALIGDNIGIVRERVEKAAARAGRDPSDIAIMAVSKFQPEEAVAAAYSAGMRLFGENRVQEAAAKYAGLRSTCPLLKLHMIGSLQSNKINKALGTFDAIQSVDSIQLLEAIVRRMPGSRSLPFELYLELHTGEESKAGFPDEDSLFRAVEAFLAMSGEGSGQAGAACRLAGLMTMAPFTDDEKAIRGSFRRLAGARDGISRRFGLTGFGGLSMGMSGDYGIAIEEGATLVRIGTAIFGERAK